MIAHYHPTPDPAKPYKERNRILKELGFASYKKYLNSPLWESIRLAVLSRDKHKCFGCGRQAKQVHHMAYTLDNLAGRDLSRLRSLCGGCHRGIEFRWQQKMPLGKANGRLRKKVRRRCKGECWETSSEYRRLKMRKRMLLKVKPRDSIQDELNRVRKEIRSIEHAYVAKENAASSQPAANTHSRE